MSKEINPIYRERVEKLVKSVRQDWKQPWVIATVRDNHAKADYAYP